MYLIYITTNKETDKVKIIIIIGLLGTMLLAPLGVLLASRATFGVSIIAFACALGIVTRIFQSEAHHADKRYSQRVSLPRSERP